MYLSYTYTVKFNPTNQLYYGSRYSINRKNMDPKKDLWKDYFTSSKIIHKLIEEHGTNAFTVTVDKVFETAQEAIDYEKEFLSEVDITQDKWLNANIAGGIIPKPEHFKLISEFHKDKPKSAEHRKKISEANKGKKSPWSVANLPSDTSGKNNSMYGKTQSEETRRKIGEANRKSALRAVAEGRHPSQNKKTCGVCGKTMPNSLFIRWGHGDNCKNQ